ncbi:MAG: mercury methylation ferredoxin HgcB [Anaerolineae bacterium]
MIDASPLNTLQYDPELCIGCEMCVIVCPHGVFAMNSRPVLSLPKGMARLVHPEACMECGACQLNCPAGAITVDSGVGCAAAMMRAAVLGKRRASCSPETELPCLDFERR